MRRYEHGVLVGERDEPVAFEDWLRSEIEYARGLDECPVVSGRLHALIEVQIRTAEALP